MEKAILSIENLSQFYGNHKILNNINLKIKKNEFITLLGPSGCGKTTLLKVIGGFLAPNEGYIFFDGKEISNLAPNKREINTVFQKYALFPNMNVFNNIAFGLKIDKVKKELINEKVKSVLKMLGLEGFEERNISSLSGGQQQRVAMARAIVKEPKLLLLDEPLSALDLKKRQEMQVELKKLQKKLGITFIYVTHDQEEALTMSNRIVVMNNGNILQIGSPQEIYNEPQTRFTAEFIGESNIIEGIIRDNYIVNILGVDFKHLDLGFTIGERVDLVIRPEDIKIVRENEGQLSGTVRDVIFQGVHYEMRIEIKKTIWIVHSTKESKIGSTVGIYLEPDDIHVMKKEDESN